MRGHLGYRRGELPDDAITSVVDAGRRPAALPHYGQRRTPQAQAPIDAANRPVLPCPTSCTACSPGSTSGWLTAALAFALPGMAGEVVVLAAFGAAMPRMHVETAGRYAAYLFASYTAFIVFAAFAARLKERVPTPEPRV